MSSLKGLEAFTTCLWGVWQPGFQAPTGTTPPGNDMQALAARGKSMLDANLADHTLLASQLPADASQRMQEQLEAYRALENKLADPNGGGSTGPQGQGCAKPSKPPPDGDLSQNYFQRMQLVTDLQVMAMRCGLRRVFVNYTNGGDQWRVGQWDSKYTGGSSEGGNASYHAGIWHQASKIANHVEVETRIFESFIQIFKKMHSVRLQNGGPTLLEQSLGVYGTQQSANHSKEGLSWLLIGGANGKHKGNQVLKFWNGKGINGVENNKVLVSILHMLGFPEVTSFKNEQHYRRRTSTYLTRGVPRAERSWRFLSRNALSC